MSFLKLPRKFTSNDPLCLLSSDAKILYAFLADRLCLSKANGEKWLTSDKEYYVVCKQTETMRILNCGHDKATAVMRELERNGLIKRITQKMGTPKIVVYLDPLNT